MHCKSLITCNTRSKPVFRKLHKKGTIIIDLGNVDIINGITIRNLLNEISDSLLIYKKAFKKLTIYYNQLKFIDKLTYIFLECIIYTLLVDYNITTEIYFRDTNSGIHTNGINHSLLLNYLLNKIDGNEFISKFNKIYRNSHFRRVIDGNAPDDSLDICNLMSEIKTFLKFFNINENYRNQISEMLSELADNAREHTKTDCLIDIDVASDYGKYGEAEDKNYCALNIAVINFSTKCIGDILKEKIINKKYCNAERYEKVNLAYNNHKDYFDKDYNETDFFNIASFQDRITGRFYDTGTGGTGLTSLIKSLEENSDTHYGYVLSGNQGIIFMLDFLKYNEDDWIGFNKENDFINKIPSKNIMLISPTYIPGTAYNFSLIVEMEGD